MTEKQIGFHKKNKSFVSLRQKKKKKGFGLKTRKSFILIALIKCVTYT